MFNFFKVLKGLKITQENTFTPKEIEIIPDGTSGTKTSIVSSQTTNRTVTIPDDTTTLLGTATTQNVSNKTITASTIDSTPIGQTTPAAVTATTFAATSGTISGDTITTNTATQTLTNKTLTAPVITNPDIDGGTIDSTPIGQTTPAAGSFTTLTATSGSIGGDNLVTENGTQTLTNKTLTAPVLNTADINNPDLDGGSIDGAVIGANTPAAITGTNVTATGDVLIQGDLTVNGTTVTLNTNTLDVEDKNITINKGGSDAASEGAGLTVDRVGTDGSLIYKAASATKFAAGDLGSEVDLVGTTSTQTLTNKTLTAPTINNPTTTGGTINNTVIGGVTPAAGTFTSMTSTTATVGGAAVTTASNTQTLTNKTISGASNTITNVSLTTGVTGVLPIANGGTNNGALGVTAGGVLYTDGTKVANVGAGTSGQVLTSQGASAPIWTTVSSGGSSSQINFVTGGDAEGANPFSGFQYGATAKPAGAPIAGAPGFTTSISSSAPISGNNSFLITKTVTAATTGSSEEIAFTVPAGYKGRLLTFEFDYILVSGTFQVSTLTQDSDLTAYIYDLDTLTFSEITNVGLLSNSTTNVTRHYGQFMASTTSTNYRLMFYCGTTNTAQFSLKVDNIRVGPASYSDEVVEATYFCSANKSVTSAQQADFNSKENDTHNAVTTGTGWIFRAPSARFYKVAFTLAQTTATNVDYYLYKNGTNYKSLGVSPAIANVSFTYSTDVYLLKGETLQIRTAVSITIVGGTLGNSITSKIAIKG